MRLPSGGHSWRAVEVIQGLWPGPEEEGVGTGLREEQLRPQGHLVWLVVAAELEIQAAKWMAVEVAEDPGMMMMMEGQEDPGWEEPCQIHSC